MVLADWPRRSTTIFWHRFLSSLRSQSAKREAAGDRRRSPTFGRLGALGQIQRVVVFVIFTVFSPCGGKKRERQVRGTLAQMPTQKQTHK